MLLIKGWLLLPALLALLSLGWGLVVERLSGARLPGVLLLPVGLAGIVVAARVAMSSDATAELAAPLVVGGALVGLVASRERLRAARVDGWVALAALVVFAEFAAPVVLGGSASFAGYSILGDIAVHFVLVDHIATSGATLGGLEPSSYRETVDAYLGSGYPLGAHAVLAAVRPLAFVDVAWAFQPFLTFMAAMLVPCLAGLLRGVAAAGWLRGAVVALAAQPALAYAYAMQGSVKEVAMLWLAPLMVAAVVALAGLPAAAADPYGFRFRLRHTIPLAVVGAAAVAVLGLAAAVWLGPVLLAALWAVAGRRPRELRRVAALAAGFALVLAALSLPTLLELRDYLDVTGDVVTAQEELGNLADPLKATQVFGIWLSGDYRALPQVGSGVDKRDATYALIALVAIAGIVALVALVRRRLFGPPLFLAVSLFALWYVTRSGSPWADAKALAIASPAVLLMALAAPLVLEGRAVRRAALALAAVLGAGVLASNALIYHQASLAPRERLAELDEVSDRLAGDGPLLYTEFEETAKHFLRDSDPVGAAESLRVDGLTPHTRDGGFPPFGRPVELSALRLADIERFPALLVRRTPLGDPPPAGYALEWAGRYYELWTRRPGAGRVVAFEALAGDGGRADCRRLRDVAARAARGGALEAAPGARTERFDTARAKVPPIWLRHQDDPTLVQTFGAGTVAGEIGIDRSGTYEIWLRGSFGRPVDVTVDGRGAGAARDDLAQPAGWVELGRMRLGAGRHRVELARGGRSLAPGSGDGPRTLGPLVLREAGRGARNVTVPVAEWRRLCGRPLRAASALAPVS